MIQPLTALQVVQVRYASHTYVGVKQRALEAYRAAGVYAQAGVPFEVAEPQTPSGFEGTQPHVQLGALGGAIAEAVAKGCRAGSAVLMTGGNCSHAPGVLGGLQDVYGSDARIGLVWFDAHGDFNTPHTSLTGNLGGMPVAVCAGLGYPEWRERAHIRAPLATDRILLVDVRNLDPDEERLIRATDAVIASVAANCPDVAPSRPDAASGYPGEDLGAAVARLAERVDVLYLHIDADILDGPLMPNHPNSEPDEPDVSQVQAAIDCVMATGKVAAFAVVSVYFCGQSTEVDLASGAALVRGGLASWRRYGSPRHL